VRNNYKLILLSILILCIISRCSLLNYSTKSSDNKTPQITSTDLHVTQTAKIIKETDSYLLSKYIWILKEKTVLQINTETNKIESKVEIEGNPIDISIGSGFVWIADSENNRIIQLNPDNNEISNTYYIVQGELICLAANDNGVWAGIFIENKEPNQTNSGGILKIDQNMNEIVSLMNTIGTPMEIKIIEDHLWILERTDSLTLFEKIGLEDQIIVSIPEFYGSPSYIHNFSEFAVTDTAIWAISSSPVSNSIFKLNKNSGEIEKKIQVSEDVNEHPVDISFDGENVWVALHNGDILNIGAMNDEIIAKYNINGSLSSIKKFDDYLWLVSQLDANIIQFDPQRNVVIDRLSIGSTPQPARTSTPRFIQEENGVVICQGADPPRLDVGSTARVKQDPPLANRVRVEPYNDTEILGEIEPGGEMLIIEGPVCSSGWVWWKIRSANDGLVGWTAEGDNETIWLEKVN